MLDQQGRHIRVPALLAGMIKGGRDMLERTSQVKGIEKDQMGAELSGRASQRR